MKHLDYKNIALKSVLLGVFAAATVACSSPTNTNYVAGKELESTDTVAYDPSSYKIEDVKLDIIFVFDTSHSMKPMINAVNRGMRDFANSIARNKYIDFRIAATASWDRRTFEGIDCEDACTPISAAAGPKGYLKRVAGSNKSYIDRNQPNLVDTLKSTLSLNTVLPADGGPEFEELLSPVYALYNAPIAGNQDFPRLQPDVYTVVILVSDAIDESLESAAQVLSRIETAKGAVGLDKTVGFAVITPGHRPKNTGAKVSSVKNLPLCLSNEKDSDGNYVLRRNSFDAARRTGISSSRYSPTKNPSKMMDLVNLGNAAGEILSICDNSFGRKVGGIGNKLVDLVIKDVRLTLPTHPDVGATPADLKKQIRVYHGRQLPANYTLEQKRAAYKDMQQIAQNNRTGWALGADARSIVVQKRVRLNATDKRGNPVVNGMYHIDYERIEDLRNAVTRGN